MAKGYARGALQAMPMVRYAILIMAGILVADNMEAAARMDVALTALSIAVGVAVLAWRRHGLLTSGAVMVGIMAAGAIRYNVMTSGMVREQMETEVEMVVASEPREYGKTIQYDAIIIAGGDGMAGHHVHVAELRHAARDTTPGGIGTRLRAARAMVTPLSEVGQTAEGHSGYRRWLMARGITAELFIPGGTETTDRKTAGTGTEDMDGLGIADRIRLQAQIARQDMMRRMAGTQIDDKTLAIAAAMTLGYKSGLDKKTRETYSMAGASHILALSGMHLSIIYMVLTMFSGRGGGWRRWMIITIVWAYVVMVGMPVSVVRAAIMLSLHHIASATGRRQHQLNIIAAAMLIILMASPAALWDIGFQLSFLAVAGIVLIAPPIIGSMPEALRSMNSPKTVGRHGRCMRMASTAIGKAGRWLWDIMAVSIAAQVMTAPLVACWFGNIATGFLLTNIIVIPSATVIIVLTLLLVPTLYITPLSSLTGATGWALGLCAGFMDSAVTEIASWPWTSITGVSCNMIQTLMLYIIVGVGITCIYRHHNLTGTGR